MSYVKQEGMAADAILVQAWTDTDGDEARRGIKVM
jgi:hypothetical protein